jgi:hypothetical protein
MKNWRHAALTLVSLCVLATAGWTEPLPAPGNFSVATDGAVFRGRWDPVPGASYYEVWTRLYGNWKFSEKDHNASPFTSSFEIPGSDERAVFKVRAVSAGGDKGAFSEESQATVVAAPEPGKAQPVSSTGVSDGFDPEAPAPPPPGSLFAVWSDPREIRLVWQSAEKATRYTIEEFRDGKWISVTEVEFPKSTTAVLKDRPMPGPYQFRVRAIGRNGRASEPSRPTSAKR